MTKIKKMTALVLVAVMALSLAACGKSSSKDPYDMIPESTKGKDVERAQAADNVFSSFLVLRQAVL